MLHKKAYLIIKKFSQKISNRLGFLYDLTKNNELSNGVRLVTQLQIVMENDFFSWPQQREILKWELISFVNIVEIGNFIVPHFHYIYKRNQFSF